MTIEINVKYGRKHIERLYGWMLFRLVDLASERAPYVNETSIGALHIYKHTTDEGRIYYNIYFYKKSIMRRFIERVTNKRIF